MAFVATPIVRAVLDSHRPRQPAREVLSPYGRRRVNEGPDVLFYRAPSLAPCVHARFGSLLRELLAETVSGPRIFELGAGTHSYFPRNERTFAEGVGLNAMEMSANDALSSFFVHDLNAHPLKKLPVHANYFNAVVCNATMPYLVRPEEVFREMRRILVPGGVLVVSFTEDCVREKATRAWRDADAEERLRLVQRCIVDPNPNHFDIVRVIGDGAQDGEGNPEAERGMDPFYAVVAKMRRKRRIS